MLPCKRVQSEKASRGWLVDDDIASWCFPATPPPLLVAGRYSNEEFSTTSTGQIAIL
jgi:hypothetical protein